MEDSLAVLLLPGRLEELELQDHARGLLSIPRVIALEPSRFRPPRFLRDSTSLRQARRLRLSGLLALLVLYHPAQYPLARALCAQHEQAELWYIAPDRAGLAPAGGGEPADELAEFDELARAHAWQTLAVASGGGGRIEDLALRERLRELDVISPRAFVPTARMRRR